MGEDLVAATLPVVHVSDPGGGRSMPLDEVLEAARNKGVAALSDIRLAILEVSGKISIIKVEQGDRS